MADVENKGYTLYSLQPLPEKGIHYVTLHLKRRWCSILKRHGIEFGLATKKMIKKNSQLEKDKEKETVYYSSWP
jgi:hypothetical protein